MEALLGILIRELKSAQYIIQAVLPILKLLTMALTGLLLSHPKIQLIPKPTLKLLSKLLFVLFWPCLIFTSLGPVVTAKKFIHWWFLPVNVVISTAIGCILGFLVALICRPPPEFFRFTVIMTAFGNTGNIPLSVVSSLCHSEDNPFGSTCYDGIAYAGFSQWVSVVLVYTLVYHMMEPPLKNYEVVEEENVEIEEVESNDVSTPLLMEAEWAGISDRETEYCKTPFVASVFKGNISVVSLSDMQEETPRCLSEPKAVKKIRLVVEHTPVRGVLQPSFIATILALLLGIIPQVKSVVFGSDAALDFITGSMVMISDAMVPAVMLVLGGMLREGPTESTLGIRTTIGIIVTRLLILPLAGIGVIYLANKWNFLVSDDSLYRFVLLLQYTTPSAILLAAIASLRGYAVSEASAILFWQHVFALITLSFYIFIYLKFLDSIF